MVVKFQPVESTSLSKVTVSDDVNLHLYTWEKYGAVFWNHGIGWYGFGGRRDVLVPGLSVVSCSTYYIYTSGAHTEICSTHKKEYVGIAILYKRIAGKKINM